MRTPRKSISSVPSRVAVAISVALLALAPTACRSGRDVEVHVRSIGIDPTTRSPVVLLEDRDTEVALPIWIGSAEAHAIAMEVEGLDPPRPMTHDLLRDALQGAGVSLEKVVIEGFEDDTYFARLHLRSLRRNFDLDARPSDAIALALRFDCPIYARESLLHGATAISLRAEKLNRKLTTTAGITVQDLDADLADVFGVDPRRGGVVVTDVAPALRGKVRRGDVILGVDGAAVHSAEELVKALGRAGRRATTLHVRRGGRDVRVELDRG